MARALTCSALTLALLLSAVPAQASEPTLGFTINPSTATLEPGQRTLQVRVRSDSTLPVTLTADALLSPELQATGWRVKVKPRTLDPGQWSTLTLKRTPRTPASDMTLAIGLAPSQAQTGMDANALRFSLAVTDPGATPQTTVRAWVTALWTWATVRLGMAEY